MFSFSIILATLVAMMAGVMALLMQSRDDWKESNMSTITSTAPNAQPIVPPTSVSSAPRSAVEVVAQNLSIPWEIAFLPNGDILITERPGTVRIIGKNKAEIPIQGVRHAGEGGLLGLVLHPKFNENQLLYLYLTIPSGDRLTTRVERYRLDENKLIDRRIIIENIPGAVYHDGGRMAFGPSFAKATEGKPDYYLYITTGDASQSDLAQDKNSLAGKILRLKDDGSIPEDNPFGSAVYSYGHRNPQGLAWDSQGRLWSNEHGRSGVLSGFDELNFIEKGANYGWPEIQGNEKRADMKSPVLHSGSRDTWAPAGLAYREGKLWFTGLKGEALYSVAVDKDGKVGPLQKYMHEQFGRLRAITVGPDGFLYISTSNKDGRGDTRPGDDKIIRVEPEGLVENQ